MEQLGVVAAATTSVLSMKYYAAGPRTIVETQIHPEQLGGRLWFS